MEGGWPENAAREKRRGFFFTPHMGREKPRGEIRGVFFVDFF